MSHNDHKVTVVSGKKVFVVYLEIGGCFLLPDDVSEECVFCKGDGAGEFDATIVEMRDENGVSVAPNAKVYRHIKEVLRADGQSHRCCYHCRHKDEIGISI